jgi:GT2 family glycosyltransferase
LNGAVRTDAGLTVVVVSYGRDDSIVDTLADLAAQAPVAPDEVLLVLQAYPDAAVERIEHDFGARLPLRIVRFAEGLGVHGARNVALARARGGVVAFLDDDVRVPPAWSATLLPYYDDPGLGGVGGYVSHPNCRRLVARLLRPVLGMASRRYRVDWGGFHTMPWSSHPAADQPADWLSGCNMSFRTDVLRTLGGFDEGYGRYGYDDVDVGVRVRQAGWRLVSSRALAVAHFPSPRNREALPALTRAEEARRVRLVRRAIGHRPLWRARFLARLALHLVATTVHGASRGYPRLAAQVLAGAREGLAAGR